MRKLNFILLFAMMFIIASCVKEGPAGPQGDKGETGAVGAQGQEGNANVVCLIFNVTEADWVISEPNYGVVLAATNITADIFASGAVQVFMGDDDIWFNMPCILPDPDFNFFSTINYSYSVGEVVVIAFDSDNLQCDNPGDMSIKVVAIAGNVLKSHPNTDWTNYKEIEKVLKLTK